MAESKEVLCVWPTRTGKKRIGSQLGINVKTVRRYALAVGASPMMRAQRALQRVHAGKVIPCVG